MLFNCETKELRSTNKDMKTYIDSCKKERVEYLEHNNANVDTVVNIKINSDNLNPQQKQHVHEEETYDKNESNKSINTCETIEPNTINKIKQIASKQKQTVRNNIAYIPHLKYYLNNLPTPSLTTMFKTNMAKQISISKTDKLSDTNRTRK